MLGEVYKEINEWIFDEKEGFENSLLPQHETQLS